MSDKTIWTETWNKNLAIVYYFYLLYFQHSGHSMYSKVSIIRPGRSTLLEFEKKKESTGCLIETFSKYPDQVV